MTHEITIRKAIQSAGVDIETYNQLQRIYTDPETLSMIIDLGVKLHGIFNRKPSERNEEIKYLKKLRDEMKLMRKDVETIIALLHELKVYLKVADIEALADLLDSKINTVNLFLIGWLENGSGNIEEQFASIHQTKDQLSKTGFANIHLYILAFKKELELAHWLGKGPEFVEQLLKDSREYFMEALNSRHYFMTPAKALARIDSSIVALIKAYPRKNMTQDGRSVIEAPDSPGWRNGYKITEYTLLIRGDIINGFSFRIKERIKEINPPRYFERGDPHFKGDFNISQIEGDIFGIDSSTPDLDAEIKRYNKAHEIYLGYMKSKLELNSVLDTISNMVSVIDNWFK